MIFPFLDKHGGTMEILRDTWNEQKKAVESVFEKPAELSDNLFKRVSGVCPRHGEYVNNRLFFMEGAGPCPVCEEERERRAALEDSARQETERERPLDGGDFAAMNIAPLYYGESLDTFNAHTAELSHHLEAVRAFCRKRKGKLLLLGGNGVGKTHLAVGALKAFRGGKIRALFEVSLMLEEQKRGGGRKALLDALAEEPLLVIDEAGGNARVTEEDRRWLSYLVNRRHERLLPLIIISNAHSAAACPDRSNHTGGFCPRCVGSVLGSDILSRFADDGIRLEFSCGDYRQVKREKRIKGAARGVR
jgi:DNA replication protein DnaC